MVSQGDAGETSEEESLSRSSLQGFTVRRYNRLVSAGPIRFGVVRIRHVSLEGEVVVCDRDGVSIVVNGTEYVLFNWGDDMTNYPTDSEQR